MPNPYDKANELAKLIEEDESYVTVKKLTEKVMADPTQLKLIEDFKNKQLTLQKQQVEGKQVDEKELEELNTLYQTLNQHSEIKQLFEAEERLSVLFNDLNRILTGPLEKIYKNNSSKE